MLYMVHYELGSQLQITTQKCTSDKNVQPCIQKNGRHFNCCPREYKNSVCFTRACGLRTDNKLKAHKSSILG